MTTTRKAPATARSPRHPLAVALLLAMLDFACASKGSSFCDEYQANLVRIASTCGGMSADAFAASKGMASDMKNCHFYLGTTQAGTGSPLFHEDAANACIAGLQQVTCGQKCFDTTTCVHVFAADWTPAWQCDVGCFGSRNASFCW
jgi:hypothetical protein